MDSTKLAYNPCQLDGRLKLTVNSFNWLGWRTCAELTVSSPEMAETIASIHYASRRRDGQAEWT